MSLLKGKRKLCVSIVARGRDGSYIVREYDTRVDSVYSEVTRVSGKDGFVLFCDGVELERGYELSKYNVEGGCDIFMVENEYILSHQATWDCLLRMAKIGIRLRDSKLVKNEDESIFFDGIKRLFAAELGEYVNDSDVILDYLHMVKSLSLVKLMCTFYKSAPNNTPIKKLGRVVIGSFIDAAVQLPPSLAALIAPVVLLFMDNLNDTPLFSKCRRNFSYLLPSFINIGEEHMVWQNVTLARLCQIVESFKFDLERGLTELTYPSSKPYSVYLKTYEDFFYLIEAVITLCFRAAPLLIPVAIPPDQALESSPIRKELRLLHTVFCNLIQKAELCLDTVDCSVVFVEHAAVTYILYIVKSLYQFSQLFKDATERLELMLKKNIRNLQNLIYRLTLDITEDTEPHSWLLSLKDSLGFVCRSGLGMNLFQNHLNNAAAKLKIFIIRAELLSSSVQAINRATPNELQQGLSIEFVNEEGEGPGVFTEWMFLVIQNLFSPENGPRLFIADENDHRTFYLNSRFLDENGQRDYFQFFGRILGLAIKNRVRIGVSFQHVLFAQFAGTEISENDMKAADLTFYKSYKQMIKMSHGELREALALEIEEDPYHALKKRVHNRFLDPNGSEVKEMCNGFQDIIGSRERLALFFRFLTSNDLNKMIGVSTNPLSIDEWRKHTDCNGFVDKDRQIEWFWKIVSDMSEEQSRLLLHFWTSTKYLPLNGFAGLDRFKIHKVPYGDRTLPASHTCISQIDLPEYPSFDVMKERINRIVAGDLDFGFGLA